VFELHDERLFTVSQRDKKGIGINKFHQTHNNDLVQGRFYEYKEGGNIWHLGPVLNGLWKKRMIPDEEGQYTQDMQGKFGVWERIDQTKTEALKAQANIAKENIEWLGSKSLKWLGIPAAKFLDSILPNPIRIYQNWSVSENANNIDKDNSGAELQYEIDKIKALVPLFVGFVTTLGIKAVQSIMEKILSGEIVVSGFTVNQSETDNTGPNWAVIVPLVVASAAYIKNLINARKSKITPTDADRNKGRFNKVEHTGNVRLERME